MDHIEKDGNCLFSSLAKGINLLAPDGHQLTSGEVRARIAVHLRKNEETYVKGWDREMPDRTKAADWGSYVTSIEGDKVWGGLTEIRAACRVWTSDALSSPLVSIWNPFMFMDRRSAVWLASTLLAIIMTCCVVMRGSFPGAFLRSGPTHRLSRCVVAALMVMMRPRSGRGSSRAASGSCLDDCDLSFEGWSGFSATVSVRSKPAAGSVPAPPSVWTSTPSAAFLSGGCQWQAVRAHTLPSCSGGAWVTDPLDCTGASCK